MSDPAKQEIIIVRRPDEEEEHHKGGVWKIAHADFMTAMMAFFLVMWLISATDKATRVTVANYFNPVQLAESSPERKGLTDPKNNSPESSVNSDQNEKPTTYGTGPEVGGRAPAKSRFKESALFQDPYAVLAKLSAEADHEQTQNTSGVDATLGETGVPGMNGGEAYRDPFDPLYWQVAPMPKPKTDTPGAPGTAPAIPRDAKLDALAPAAPTDNDKPTPTASQTSDKPAQKLAAANDAEAAKQSVRSQDVELKAEIAKAVQNESGSSATPHVEVNRTGDGVLISITDELDFSMFAVGSAEPQPKVVRAMEKIAKILSARTGRVIIRGHTDGRPFKSETYDNWRLSTARAHMASYMLVRGGLDESRIERVEGHADRSLKNAADPKAPENRRIEILLRDRPS
ncbi:MotB family protein [Microvirga sp. 2MCAF38]|uniref:MotB family protein n=1 Tax=Microvirga sp. 2MCAF38 TaxID=3232989 RepID=UPI003F9A8C3B